MAIGTGVWASPIWSKNKVETQPGKEARALGAIRKAAASTYTVNQGEQENFRIIPT